jgi:hypothetical protein
MNLEDNRTKEKCNLKEYKKHLKIKFNFFLRLILFKISYKNN